MSLSNIATGLKAILVAGGGPADTIHTTPRNYYDPASLVQAAKIAESVYPKREVYILIITEGEAVDEPDSCMALVLRHQPVNVDIYMEADSQQTGTSDYTYGVMRTVAENLMGTVWTNYTLNGSCAWIVPGSVTRSPIELTELGKGNTPSFIKCWHCTVSFTAVERRLSPP